MLGVAVVEVKGTGVFLVDVWRAPEGPGRNKRGPTVHIYNCGEIGHGQLWSFLQRGLRLTEESKAFADPRFVAAMLEIDPSDFAWRRNDLHYQNHVWLGDDLHTCVTKADFGKVSAAAIDPEQDDFLLSWAFWLVHTARTMLSLLAETSGTLREEGQLIDTWLRLPFNRLYQDNVVLLPSELPA